MDILSSVIKYSKKIFVYTSMGARGMSKMRLSNGSRFWQFHYLYNSTSQAEVMNNPEVEHVNAQLPLACP
jgi:hypothetical protein